MSDGLSLIDDSLSVTCDSLIVIGLPFVSLHKKTMYNLHRNSTANQFQTLQQGFFSKLCSLKQLLVSRNLERLLRKTSINRSNTVDIKHRNSASLSHAKATSPRKSSHSEKWLGVESRFVRVEFEISKVERARTTTYER